MTQHVRLTGIDLSLQDWMVLFIKVAIAAIPAMIILSVVYMLMALVLVRLFTPRMMGM